MIIYSLVLIIVMLYRPTGLMGTKEITQLFKFGKKEVRNNDWKPSYQC